MWTANRPPSRPARTPSVHSIASQHSSRPNSMVSPLPRTRSGGYESDQSSDTANDDDFIVQNQNFPQVPTNAMPPMWQSQRQQSGSAVSRLSQKFGANAAIAEIAAPAPLRQQRHQPEESDDDTHSRASTLGGEEQDFEFPEKTPTLLPRMEKLNPVHEIREVSDDSAPKSAPHIPGPLESQLASLMSKLIFMERENAAVSVTPEDFAEMSKELKALREEKKTWTKRHEAIWALRDEDVENNIKIRGMLAKDRRALEGMTKLRDDDLLNLQAVRVKLAEATRRLGQLEQSGRSSPSRTGRPTSVFTERRGTMDLFAAAKAAALEQRALELEQRNADLLQQIEMLKGGANIDDLNRVVAHKAWKDTVADMETKLKAKDAEVAKLKSGGSSMVHPAAMGTSASAAGLDLHRFETLHEEHASYREKVGGRMQQLRSEKEALQKELHRKEDECHSLEAKVQSLQRRVALM